MRPDMSIQFHNRADASFLGDEFYVEIVYMLTSVAPFAIIVSPFLHISGRRGPGTGSSGEPPGNEGEREGRGDTGTRRRGDFGVRIADLPERRHAAGEGERPDPEHVRTHALPEYRASILIRIFSIPGGSASMDSFTTRSISCPAGTFPSRNSLHTASPVSAQCVVIG